MSRIAERLGGGEFGDVVRGYWKAADYSVGVALKTLSGEQGQEGRRKLLQEAAIMSQFKHPNVVQLYGVVNDDQQVRTRIFSRSAMFPSSTSCTSSTVDAGSGAVG